VSNNDQTMNLYFAGLYSSKEKVTKMIKLLKIKRPFVIEEIDRNTGNPEFYLFSKTKVNLLTAVDLDALNP
jgi:hypothetical protein